MMTRVALLATACLAMASPASGFVAQPAGGLALRSSPLAAASASTRRSALGPKMQLQELAGATADAVNAVGGVDGAMLLAKSIWPAPLVDATTAYMNLFAPLLKSLNLPPFLLHWFHGLNMGLVLGTMGGYGAYLGWKTRLEPASAGQLAAGPAWANLGKSNADLHKTLMGAMALIFFLGANGGLVLCLVQGKPIMESSHFTSAMAGFGLLGAQAALTTRFTGENAATARTTHAFLGSATAALGDIPHPEADTDIIGDAQMAVFFYHAFLGLQLGFEFSK